MLAFWIGAILLTALAAYPIVHLAARPRAIAADPARAVYRRQLAEIDELAQRGVLAEGEVKSAHAEAARRLLGVRSVAEEKGASKVSRLVTLAAIVLIGLAAPMVYLFTGAPGQADQPFAKRLATWRSSDPATLTPPQIVAVLSALTAQNPKDIQALTYLARAQTSAGDAPAAARTLLRALKLDDRRADLWSLLGQLRVAEAEDQLTPDAREAFARALAIDPKAPAPRYYLARAKIEAGDTASGIAEWRALAAELPAAGRAALEQDIAAASRPQSAAPMPSTNDIVAMVEGLAARLAAAPNDPAGWERLVRSYRVLGDEHKLEAALAQARVQFKGQTNVLARIEAAGEGR